MNMNTITSDLLHHYKMTAYGVELHSLRGDAREMAQMLRFANLLAHSGATQSVRSVLYDSAKKCVLFLFNESIQDTAQQHCVFDAAGKTLSRFVWLDNETYLGDLE